MILLYQFGIICYRFLVLVASFFSKKADYFYKGQKTVMANLPNGYEHKIIWVHCASLGEFELIKPLLKQLKTNFKENKILLTFFSPSGYRHAESENLFDFKSYLPIDSTKNAKEFIHKTNPQIAIFIKNECWFNYLLQLQKNKITTVFAVMKLRPNHYFFKWYGSWQLSILKKVSHFLVQDAISKNLLRQHNINQIKICGDSRFDRVIENAKNKKSIPFIKEFKGSNKLIVCGSTYTNDSELILQCSKINTDIKFIIAPHQIELSEKLKHEGVLYSQLNNKSCHNNNILIIDNIGMLSQIYQYADLAYIGGGFSKKGLHNILEPMAFGIPIAFGPNFKKNDEAVETLDYGIAHCIKSIDDFNRFVKMPSASIKTKTVLEFCEKRKGATQIIFDDLKSFLN